MFDRIESILKSLGLAQSYLKNFEDNAMDDDTVEICFQSESDLAALKEVIPLTGHRMRFIKAFREQLAENAGQVGGRNEKCESSSSVGEGRTFSAGSSGSRWEHEKNGTSAFGEAYKSGYKLANSLFEAFNSAPGPGKDTPKVFLDRPPGHFGASVMPASNNSELAKPFCTFGFEGNQRSSDSLDISKDFGVDLEESLTSSSSSTRSVQIMDFEEAIKGNAVRKIVFYEDEFRRVINKCDPSRPVAVLAVAGKENKGKSLFLSYVLRYLKALQEGNPDWLGWNETAVRPLDGFGWANGYEVVTRGIWIWSEPITCKNFEGQEYDVLLMDTQGVFDEKTEEREWAILAGLSLLTSSLMVLNTSNGIHDDTLESLQNFLSFGCLVLDQDDNPQSTKPFQNLVFMVRDWGNYEEFPCGNEGGREFIQRKLEEKPDHDDFHQQLRRQMKACFENIDCFLLPHPGLATRESSFTGSVVNATAEYSAFAKQMQLCIEQLVNPNHFPLKTLNGNILTAPDIFEMFKSYIENFNSDTIPSSIDLYNVAVERCNNVILSRCVDLLVKNFEAKLSSVPFLIERDFNRTHKAAEEQALVSFKKARKMGDMVVIAAVKAELMTKLDDIISHYRSTNQNKLAEARQHFEAGVREISADYESELESKVGKDVFYEDIFDEIHKEVASNACRKFQDLQCDPLLESEILPVLAKRIKNTDKWLQVVKLNMERVERSLQATVADAEREYRNALDLSKFIEVKELETAEAEARGEALSALRKFPYDLRKSTLNKAEVELTTQLDAVYKKVLEQVGKKCEAEQMYLELAIVYGVRQYKTSMETLLMPFNAMGLEQEPTLTDLPARTEDLNRFHLHSESAALETLREFLNVNSEKFKNVAHRELESEEQLRDRIAQEFSDLKHRNLLKSENVKAKVVKYLSDAQQEFIDEMKQAAQGTNDEATLRSRASQLRIRVKSKFENHVGKSAVDEAILGDHFSRLDSHMDELVRQYVTIMEMKRREDEVAVQGALADARNFYSDQMKTAREAKSWYPMKEFKEINDKVLEETVMKFKEEASLTSEQAEQLRQSLKGPYSRFEEENRSFIPTDSHAIGIDLGTTYSCVGVYVNGKVDIIQENEKFTIPSCVYYGEGETRAVGEAAQDGAFRSPEDFIFDAKRLMGRNWNDKVVQDDIKQWNFNVVQVDGQPIIKCRAGLLRPEEVSAEVLAHLKSLAEKHLGQQVTSAVVTVPAYFNEGQRQATKDAATMAGLSAKILTEPVAAAIAYRLDRAGDLNKNVLVFDLGGGTFDVAVLEISGRNIDVKTINGDTHLGGEDFDKAMVMHVIEKAKAKTGRDLLRGKNSSHPDTRKKVNNLLRRLKLECERKKRDLSSVQMVHIRLEEVGWNLDVTIMRTEFENLINRDLEKCMEVVKTALKDAKMSKNDIDEVVLVGGSTKIPKVHEMLKDYFNGMQLKHAVNPDQAVAHGAAILAAIKGGMTQGKGLRNKILVQDCTPSSIGIEDMHGDFVVQVPKGSKIPVCEKQIWVPKNDYQNACDYHVYEGEAETAKANHFLGKFLLHLPSVRKEDAMMETTTVIDDEGILTVKAVCLMDGNENDIQIDAYKGRMSKEGIEERRVDIAQRRT